MRSMKLYTCNLNDAVSFLSLFSLSWIFLWQSDGKKSENL